jgi:4-amino-4-deoxy-L-arabinose transferase-like glycosyltransferase
MILWSVLPDRTACMRPQRLLFLLVVIFIGLACYYSITTPTFESPDEVWHYQFIRQVAVNRGLPVVIPGADQPFRHEGLQPPLYYALGAVLIAWMNPRELENLPRRNPYARIGEPAFATNDNRNAFLHTFDETFPYRGAALAAHLLRLYSVLLGAATVVFTFLLAREILKPTPHPQTPLPPPFKREGGEGAQGVRSEGESIALFAAAFVAFLPQFLFISGAISNDNLATMLSAATLWQLARLMKRGLAIKSAVVLGLFVGGALLAKVSTIALIPVVLLVIAYLTWRKRAWLQGIQAGAVFLAVVAIIAGWWYVRNVQLYGEIYPFTPLAALVGARPTPSDLWRWIGAEGEGLRLSAWGVFGWFNILSSPWFYLFYDALAALGLLGLMYALVRRENLALGLVVHQNDPAGLRYGFLRRRIHILTRSVQLHHVDALAILPIWIGLCFIALWRYSSMIVSTQGRLLFPALPAWGALWAWGMLTPVPSRFRAWEMGAIGGALFASALLTPSLFIAPAYIPTIITENELPANVTRLDRRFENGVEWLGASVDRTNVRAGEALTVIVYERVSEAQAPYAATFIHLVNSAEVIVAQRDGLIGSGNLSTRQAPYVVADTFRVVVPVTAPAPDDWRVEMGIYDPSSGRRFTAFDQGGRGLGEALTLSTIHGQAGVPAEWNFDFDGRVSLDGAELDRTALMRGEVLRLTLHWRGVSTGPNRYHVFAHALGGNDRIWAAADNVLGGQPATKLDLHFDPATPPGVYPLEVGVYPEPDGDRLEVFDAHGQDLGDRVFLGPVRVTVK